MAVSKRYLEDWGNYKSDEHKSKSLLREEIRDILVHGTFCRKTLILIRDLLLKLDES